MDRETIKRLIEVIENNRYDKKIKSAAIIGAVRFIIDEYNTKSTLNVIDLDALLKKHNDMVEDYIYDREEKARYVNNFQEFLEKIKERLVNFGYGSTTFHTADINLMLLACEEVQKHVKTKQGVKNGD